MYDNLTSHEELIIKCIHTELAVILGFFNDKIYNEEDYINLTGIYITLQGKIIHGTTLNNTDLNNVQYLLGVVHN